MNLIERFTRDRASRFVWGLVALACALAFLIALRGEDRASARSLDGAASRSLVYANQVIAPLIEEKSDGLHLYYKTVYPSVQAGIFTDPQVAVVRVWGADGSLLFASDGVGRLAGQVHANGTWIQIVLEGRTYSQIVVEPYTASTTGTTPSDTTLFQTFTPLLVPDRIAPVGAVEVDYLYDSLHGEGARAWARLQWVLGVLFLASLLLFVLSMRAPREVPAGSTSWRTRMDRLRGGSTVEPDAVELAAPSSEVAVPVVVAEAPASPATATAVRADVAASARVAELEEALAAAEWELSGLKNTADAHAATVAALESERGEHAARAQELSGRVAELEAQLAELEAAEGASGPEPAAAEPEPEPTAAEPDGEREATSTSARSEVVAEAQADVGADVEPAVNGERADPLSLLEARLTAAEQRAVEAGDRVSQASGDAADLRARLARTAARKKGIAAVDDEAPPNGSDEPSND